MKTRTLMILAPLVLSSLAFAKETVWTGVQNASWTEPNNWTAGVPEMFDTAVFDATGASGATTIDLAGQTMVTNIVVRGSGCPKYVFGTSATQKLLLPFTASQTDGSGFIVESSVPAANVPEIAAVLGGTIYAVTSYLTVDNQSSGTLVMNDYGYATKAAGVSSPYPKLNFAGSGPVRINGTKNTLGQSGYTLEMSFRGTGKVTIAKNASLGRLYGGGDKSIVRELEIPADVTVNISGANLLNPVAPMHISGAGALGIQAGNNNFFEGEMATDGLFANQFDVRFFNQGDPKAIGIHCYGRGVWTFGNTANDLGGALDLYCDNGSSYITFAAPVFGRIADSSSCLGPNVARIIFSRNGRVRHTGSTPDTTDRTFVFGEAHKWSTINSTMRIEQNGAGTFTITGGFESESGANSAALTLAGTGSGDGVIASVLTNQPGRALTLTKIESGRWVLTGANTYTGATTVEAGTLAFRDGGSIASSPLTLKGGARLEIAGTTSVMSIAHPSGASTIALDAGARLDLTGMTSAAGTIAVTAGEGAVLVCPALSGTAPAWLTLNGKSAEFDASGRLVKLDVAVTDSIAARGGVIPDGSSKIVGLTTDGAPGAGPVTLAANSVTIDTLAQKTYTDAVVSLAGGRLTLDTVFISEGRAGLTLGATPGDGTLAAASDRTMTFDSGANDPTGITVNAALDADAIQVRSGTLRLAESSYTGSIALAKDACLVLTNEAPMTFQAQVTGSQASSNRIVKTGAGPAKYTSLTGYSGDFVLAGGTNEISKALCGSAKITAFGAVPDTQAAAATAGSVYVMDGATLFANDDPAASSASSVNGLTFGYKNFHFSGTGVGELGALIIRDSHVGLFRNITLDGNTLFRGERGGYAAASFKFNENGTLDMQGHSLDLVGTCSMVFADNSKIVNAGRLTLNADASSPRYTVSIYANADLGDAEDEPIVMKGDFSICSYRAKTQRRPFVFDSDLTGTSDSTAYPRLSCIYNDAGTNLNHFAGDIVFADSNVTSLRIANDGGADFVPTVTLSGNISGHGGFLIPKWWNQSQVCLYLAGENNTFTEGVRIPQGYGTKTVLRLAYPTSVPNYGKIDVNAARVMVDAWNWTGTNMFKLAREAKIMGSYSRIYGYTAEATASTATVEIDGGSYEGTEKPIDHVGPGTLRLKPSGTWNNNLKVAPSCGTVALTGPGSVSLGGSMLSVSTATDAVEPAVLSFEGGVSATLDYGPICVGYSVATTNGSDRIARLRFGQSTVRASAAAEAMSGVVPLRIGQDGDGIMEILPGADVRTSFLLGFGNTTTNSSHGAIYQSGGTLDANGNASYYGYPWIGCLYGFYSISGGLLKSDEIRTAMYGSSYSSLRQAGGETQIGNLRLGTHHSVADWVVSDGNAYLNTLFPPNPGSSVRDQVSVVTVERTGSVVVSNVIYAAGGVDTTDAIFNLNGGTFAVASIARHGSQDWMTDHASDRVFVNFNGGTLKALQKDQQLLGSGVNAVTRATVYAGGATVDTSDLGADEYAVISVPLTAPTGKGVASIPSPGAVITDRDLVGPPGVKIIGDGMGASAVCDFNVSTRQVTGVRVTCPGCDYTWAKAEFSYGFDEGVPFVVTNDCVLTSEAPTSGGLVKTGAGILRLGGGSTYAGDTVVEGGTLFLAATNSLPESSRVTCRGGTVAVANDVTMPPVDCVYAIGRTVVSSGSIDFAAGSTVLIIGLSTVSDEVDSYVVAEFAGGIGGVRPTVLNENELPTGWKVQFRPTSICVRKENGTVIIFR